MNIAVKLYSVLFTVQLVISLYFLDPCLVFMIENLCRYLKNLLSDSKFVIRVQCVTNMHLVKLRSFAEENLTYLNCGLFTGSKNGRP